MTRVPKPSDPTSYYTYTYDARNRLVKIEDGVNTVAEYEYDGAKRRTIEETYSGGASTKRVTSTTPNPRSGK
jgi:YD repeat-containing protein